MLKKVLLITFTTLWILDTVFTLMFVSNFGLEAEGNPFMRWLLLYTGEAGFVAVKFATCAVLYPLCNQPDKRDWLYNGFLFCLIVILVPVVILGGRMALVPL